MGERYKKGEIGGYIGRARCIDKGIKRELYIYIVRDS